MNTINRKLLKSLTVLYVEDEDIIKEEIKFFCEKFIPNFYTAGNGEEGLELYKKVNPDIVITDIQMPKMNGLEMIKHIDPSLPIIITTAYSDIEFFLQAIELNVNKFIIKPIDLKILLISIQECIINERLKDNLFEKENLLKIVDENVLISITDEKGKIIRTSDAFCKFVGYSKDELIGRTHSILRHEDTPNSFYENMWEEIKSGKVFRTEIKNRKKDAEEYWASLTITPAYDENGNVANFTAIREDITNKKRLEKLAIKDEVTKLYNRRYFNIIIDKELRRVKREKSIISMATLDIDNFKKYNDTYGHPMGDEVLLSVSTVLKNAASRASDYAFRLGGEEFCILFSGIGIDESHEYINAVVKDVEKLMIEHRNNDNSNFLTISAGLIVLSHEYLVDENDLYRFADDALYEAKRVGKNQTILSKHCKI